MAGLDVFDVFTPGIEARANFVPREAVNEHLVEALQTPGIQVVVYGETGSGKSSLISKKLEELYTDHITTYCSKTTTFQHLLYDAFDQLNPYFVDRISKTRGTSVGSSISGEFLRLRAIVDASMKDETVNRSARWLPPQLTVQRLGEFLGQSELCWVLEDFHKVPTADREALSQGLKTISDLGTAYPRLKVIAVGAAATARQVVEYDRDMRERVMEINVPLMSRQEIDAIIVNGEQLLNVDMTRLRGAIVSYASGVAAVCHRLALNACLHEGIRGPTWPSFVFDLGAFEPALTQWAASASDRLAAAFDAALAYSDMRKHRHRRLVLTALANGSRTGMRRPDILLAIRLQQPRYPAGVLAAHLDELVTQDADPIVELSSDSRYRFLDPLHHTFARVTLGSADRSVAERAPSVDEMRDVLLRLAYSYVVGGQLP